MEVVRAKFEPSSGFYEELKRRVDVRLADAGITARDRPAMYFKAVLILSWFVVSYVGLVFWSEHLFSAILWGASLAMAMGGIGFSIAHDSNHGAVSDKPWLNSLGALCYDLLGTSSYLWRLKHNFLHHSYTNVTGFDSDIESEPFLRLSPHQRHRWFHNLQEYYAWFLYALLVVQWQTYSDYRGAILGKVGRQKVRPARGKALALFWGGKMFFVTWALLIPMTQHPFWVVILGFAGVSGLLSVVISVVFQMAHCTSHADFIQPQAGGETSSNLGREWAKHQVEATVNFGRRNPVLSWYLGGLNFQIEHHLLPKICHVNYPLIAPVVELTCNEYGVKYSAHPSLRVALASHAGWLSKMGRSTSH